VADGGAAPTYPRDCATLPSTIRYSETFDVSLPDLVSAVRQHGLEGIVAKRAGSSYRSGERCDDWLKWRANRAQEFVIGGYIPGDDVVDSILVGYYEDRDLIYAGCVRAGLRATSCHALVPYFEELRVPQCRWFDPSLVA
jgi:ATP-dependent DNA ligase